MMSLLRIQSTKTQRNAQNKNFSSKIFRIWVKIQSQIHKIHEIQKITKYTNTNKENVQTYNIQKRVTLLANNPHKVHQIHIK